MWFIIASQQMSPEMAVKSFKKCVHAMQRMRLMTRCTVALKRMGMFGVGARKMKTLTVKMETVTMNGKGR